MHTQPFQRETLDERGTTQAIKILNLDEAHVNMQELATDQGIAFHLR